MDYNEFDDYGTGFEEAAERKYEEMIDAQVRELIGDASEADERWGAEMDKEIALLLKK